MKFSFKFEGRYTIYLVRFIVLRGLLEGAASEGTFTFHLVNRIISEIHVLRETGLILRSHLLELLFS